MVGRSSFNKKRSRLISFTHEATARRETESSRIAHAVIVSPFACATPSSMPMFNDVVQP
jgi:hypothetical protein